MKKILASILCMTMIIVFASGSALADAIIPLLAAEPVACATISISDGNAQAIGKVSWVPTGYSVSITVSLQKKAGNTWTNVTSVAGARSANASATAVKGTTYRSHVMCKVYDSSGNLIDTLTLVSNTQTY